MMPCLFSVLFLVEIYSRSLPIALFPRSFPPPTSSAAKKKSPCFDYPSFSLDCVFYILDLLCYNYIHIPISFPSNHTTGKFLFYYYYYTTSRGQRMGGATTGSFISSLFPPTSPPFFSGFLTLVFSGAVMFSGKIIIMLQFI